MLSYREIKKLTVTPPDKSIVSASKTYACGPGWWSNGHVLFTTEEGPANLPKDYTEREAPNTFPAIPDGTVIDWQLYPVEIGPKPFDDKKGQRLMRLISADDPETRAELWIEAKYAAAALKRCKDKKNAAFHRGTWAGVNHVTTSWVGVLDGDGTLVAIIYPYSWKKGAPPPTDGTWVYKNEDIPQEVN